MSHTRRHALITLGAAAAALAGTRSWAQDTWPSKAINYVVPFTPGGSTDVVGRVLAEKLAGPLGQPVVVDNKPGAAGAVGASYVAKAKPDGYTLFGGTISTHAINASLYKNLSYDPVKDFEPVSLVAFLPNVLIVDPALGVNTVQELVELLKRDPNKRTFASSGAGTSTHLAGELFAGIIGVPLTHVPYKGTPPAMLDVSAGLVPFMFDQLTAARPLVQAGKLKLLAVTTGKRVAAAPARRATCGPRATRATPRTPAPRQPTRAEVRGRPATRPARLAQPAEAPDLRTTSAPVSYTHLTLPTIYSV